MTIQIDTREKERAISGIIKEFEKQGVPYIVSKLYMADYMDWDNPRYVIDRKQNIREIATNCTTEQKRLEAELEKLNEIGAHMTFLITQDRIGNKRIKSLEDLILWQPPKGHGTVNGETVFRKLRRWERMYPIDFQFCSKAEAGKVIIKLLRNGGDADG